MNARFEGLLTEAGYVVRHRKLRSAEDDGCVAENPYFAVAFQPFPTWAELRARAGPAELELAASMRRGSSKVWDTYLLLACQETLHSRQQFDELVGMQYDTRRMRKLVTSGAGDTLKVVDALVRPFLELQRIQTVAQGRDPLAALAAKLVTRGQDARVITRVVDMFREGMPLDDL